MEGHSAELKAAQVWTWDEAQRIIDGIRYVQESQRMGHSVVPVYTRFDPSLVRYATPGGEPQRGPDPRAVAARYSTRLGCRCCRARDD